MDLHENLRPLAGLVGAWRGPGAGEYPTISPFTYTEELTFTDVGKPFLTYQQRTWSPTGAPMHTESGFVRVPTVGRVEITLAQPTGQTELLEGSLEETAGGFAITLAGRIVNSTTAKIVEATEREYVLTTSRKNAQERTLSTQFAMAAVGVPMTHHLASDLHFRQPD